MHYRAFRYRLEPTDTQAETFRQWAGVCRLIYNLAWEQRHVWGRSHREISFVSQNHELTRLRAEVDWIGAGPQSAQEAALRDLDGAYRRFFARDGGYPTPRRKGANESFRFRGRDVTVRRLNAKWAYVRIPKLGNVKVRLTRPIAGELLTVTVKYSAGSWFVSLLCEVEASAATGASGCVGIDRGVATALALSSGELIHAPKGLTAIDKRKRAAQRALGRKKRGSNRHRRQRDRIAKLSARCARIRQDFNHRATARIATHHDVVAIEDLKIKGMTASAAGTIEAPGRCVSQKRGLNRAILDKGWRQFETFLGYKLAERGGRLLKVHPAYTSQTCSACGTVDARSRESQARFVCVECGHRDHADVNAAKNILRRSTALLDVEGAHFVPRESSTKLAA